MTVVSSAAALAPAASRTDAQERRIRNALQMYRKPFQTAVCHVAASHERLADLAVSFPALLFVIAVPHKDRDALSLRSAVIAGLPLKVLAKMAKLPMWLRKLPPHGFDGVIGALPTNNFISAQLAHHVPVRKRDAEDWLRQVSLATCWGTDDFALWIAKRPVAEREKLRDTALCKLAMLAWFSSHPETRAGKLCKRHWHSKLDLKGAARRWSDWTPYINLELFLHLVPSPPLLQQGQFGGFEFLHLGTTELIAEEAARMGNCIMGYGKDISQSGTELWSMRKNGTSVATISIADDYNDLLASITEIKGPGNSNVSRDVALVARRWFQSHDIAAISPIAPPTRVDGRVKTWQCLFKPYWIFMGRLPSWMQFAPEDCYLGGVYLYRKQRRRHRPRR